ncbi:MAG: pentapeptide repeat-containing protein [Pseudomonadota bacterium]
MARILIIFLVVFSVSFAGVANAIHVTTGVGRGVNPAPLVAPLLKRVSESIDQFEFDTPTDLGRVWDRMAACTGAASSPNVTQVASGRLLNDRDLSGRDEPGGDFASAEISNTVFRDAILSQAIFDGAKGTSPNFAGANLAFATYRQAFLPGAVFTDTDMRSAKMYGALLAGGDFSKSDLTSIRLSASDVSGGRFSGTYAPKALFVDARAIGTDFSGADLRGADFRGANLNSATFDGADITRVSFDGAHLNGVDLTSAVGAYSISLIGACGDSLTKVPLGMSLKRCDPAQPSPSSDSRVLASK